MREYQIVSISYGDNIPLLEEYVNSRARDGWSVDRTEEMFGRYRIWFVRSYVAADATSAFRPKKTREFASLDAA
jgi:hypothetical protein